VYIVNAFNTKVLIKELKMRICKLDKTEQIWGRGGAAAGPGAAAIGVAVGSDGAPGTTANAVVGAVAGIGASTVVGPIGGAFTSGFVASTLNGINAANSINGTFGITMTDTMCLNPAMQAPAININVDALGSPTSSVDGSATSAGTATNGDSCDGNSGDSCSA
jgi:hypothetical protein